MTKQIPLTQGKVALVDDEDYGYISGFKWRAAKLSNGKFYAVRTSAVSENKPENIYMHREIMGAIESRLMIDHVDENKTLDNRKCNLRHANRSQNKSNTKAYKNNKSGYKGVYFTGKKYQAQIRKDKRLISLGTFDNPTDAARAYDEAAKKYHGIFAKTNM